MQKKWTKKELKRMQKSRKEEIPELLWRLGARTGAGARDESNLARLGAGNDAGARGQNCKIFCFIF